MEQVDFSLAGQVALVSGASRGIGHDLVIALAGAGATVAAGARSTDDVAELVAEVTGRGGRAFALELDVTDGDSVNRAVERALADQGKIESSSTTPDLGRTTTPSTSPRPTGTR